MTPQTSFNQWIESNLADIDAILLDIDGVLINNHRRLPGSRRLLRLLRSNNLPFILLTNDGNHSTREKSQRLKKAGLDISPQQIISCGHGIRPIVDSLGLSGERFFIMGDTGNPCYAQAAGLKVTRNIERLAHCTGVIIGEENYDWETVINAVINYFIDHPHAPLIVPNPDEFYPGPLLKIHIGAGGVGRFIQSILKAYGVPISPIYLGKPHAPIFRMAQNALEKNTGRKLRANRILMLGDNLAADISGARSMGFATALMLTGVTPLHVLESHEIIPDMVFNTL